MHRIKEVAKENMQNPKRISQIYVNIYCIYIYIYTYLFLLCVYVNKCFAKTWSSWCSFSRWENSRLLNVMFGVELR